MKLSYQSIYAFFLVMCLPMITVGQAVPVEKVHSMTNVTEEKDTVRSFISRDLKDSFKSEVQQFKSLLPGDTSIVKGFRQPLDEKGNKGTAADLLQQYMGVAFRPDEVSGKLKGAGRALLQQQKADAMGAYRSLIRTVVNQSVISQVKDWHNYLDKLSPRSLAGRIPPELNGKAFSHTGLVITEQGQVLPSYFGNTYDMVNSLSLSDQLSIKNIPLAISFIRQDLTGDPHVSRNIFSSSFSKEAFLENMRKRLRQTLSPEDLFPDDHLLEMMHQGVATVLKHEVDSIMSTAKMVGERYIRQFSDPEALLDQDMSVLSAQLFSQQYKAEIKGKINLLQQLKQKVNNGKAVDRLLMDSVSSQVLAYGKLQEAYSKILEIKEKWQNDPVVKKLKELNSLKEQKFEELLDNPATLKQLAGKYLPLNGLEKIFANINSLDMGEHTTSLSPLSLSGFTSSGGSIEMQNGNKYLMLIAGKEKGLNSVFDRQNFEPLFPDDHNLLGISLGTGEADGDHTHLTLMSYSQQENSSFHGTEGVPKNNVLVAGVDNQFSLGDNTTINMELSKSALDYQGASDADGSNPSVLGKLADMSVGGSSLAGMLRMQGYYPKIGLNAQASLSLIARGYYNPGNLYLPRGTKEIRFNTRKNFLKRRLTLSVRGDIRQYQFGTDNDSHMDNTYFSFEGKWNIKNGQFISFSYQPVKGTQDTGRMKDITGITNRFQAAGCIQQPLLGTFYRNMFNVAWSRNKYNWGAAGNVDNVSVTYSSMQSIVLSGNLLYANITYNHANNLSSVVYFNSTFTSELGYTYTLGKKINGSTGIEYDAAEKWYTDVGIRQSLSMDINTRFGLNFYVDLKKNIRTYNTGFYNDLYQANWSLHYSF